MGLRFRKSIKIAPGVKLNIGSKSVGVSLGGKFAGISLNSRTGAQVRASAPGTGLSYTKKIGGKKKTSASGKKTKKEQIEEQEVAPKELEAAETEERDFEAELRAEVEAELREEMKAELKEQMRAQLRAEMGLPPEPEEAPDAAAEEEIPWQEESPEE